MPVMIIETKNHKFGYDIKPIEHMLFLKQCEWRFNHRPIQNLLHTLLQWIRLLLLKIYLCNPPYLLFDSKKEVEFWPIFRLFRKHPIARGDTTPGQKGEIGAKRT